MCRHIHALYVVICFNILLATCSSIHESINRRTDRRTDGRTAGGTGRWAGRQTDGRTDGRADGRTDGRTCGRTDGRSEAYLRVYPKGLFGKGVSATAVQYCGRLLHNYFIPKRTEHPHKACNSWCNSWRQVLHNYGTVVAETPFPPKALG